MENNEFDNQNIDETQDNQNIDETQENQNVQGQSPEGQNNANEQTNWYESDYYGSPDNYDYKEVKLPEGMELNQDMTTRFNDFAKKTNMSQKSANECMQLAVEHTNMIMKQVAEAQQFIKEENIQKWDKLCDQDEFLKGNKYDEAISIANMAMDKLIPADSDFKEKLIETGLNHHPVLINAFRQLGEFMLPQQIKKGTSSIKEKSAAEVFYPEMYQNK